MPSKPVSSIIARLLGGLMAGAAAAALLINAPALGQAPAGQPPAKTEIASDRVELIMGALPPKGAPQYTALRALAGPDVREHILPLTRCEVWTISRARLSRLLVAARQANVSVKELDGSWNEVFAATPAPGHMDGVAHVMMEHAKQSRSTAGMTVMGQRTASMVEYALTKGMGTKPASAQPMSIRIALNERTVITAERRDVVISGERCTWRGVVAGTSDPVTIMWWGSGRMTGTIHHGGRLYQLRQLAPDLIGIVETMPEMLPDEHPRTAPQRMQKMNMREDTLFMHGDSSGARLPRPRRDQIDDLKDDVPAKPAAKTATGPAKAAKGARKSAPQSGQPMAIIDVMVIYTRKAAARYSDIRRDLIELAIEETNHSFRASRIDNVAVRLVHTHETDYDEAGAEHFDHVWRMVDRGDGHLEEVPALRGQKNADIVILVVDDPSGCGLATRVAADADEAFAVVHHECAATSYSIAHEIGHIIAARHDHSLDTSKTPFAYGHGFVNPDLKWRTMMSYKAACNGCPRLPIWSTPAPVVNGQPAGDQERDNARVLRERAARVAAFR